VSKTRRGGAELLDLIGSSPALGEMNAGRLAYDPTTQKLRVSLNGGAFVDVMTAADITTDRTLTAVCLDTDAPGMCVSATPAGVARMTPLITGLVSPAIGVITRKLASTLCTVLVFGEVEVAAATLQPGRPCWVGIDGYPTSTRPVPAPGERIATQVLGVALSDRRLLVDPERRPIIATGGLPR
jgi:hypothetical protein